MKMLKIIFACSLLTTPLIYSNNESLEKIVEQIEAQSWTDAKCTTTAMWISKEACDKCREADRAKHFEFVAKLRNHPDADKPLHTITDAFTENKVESTICGIFYNDDRIDDKTECFYGTTRYLKKSIDKKSVRKWGETGTVTSFTETRFKPELNISINDLFKIYDDCQQKNSTNWKPSGNKN